MPDMPCIQTLVSVAEFITVRFQRFFTYDRLLHDYVSVAEFITVRFQHRNVGGTCVFNVFQ